MFARDHTNRYFRHVVHCKSCLWALNGFKKFQKVNGVGLMAIVRGIFMYLWIVCGGDRLAIHLPVLL
jgi:hypothetical protein